MSISYNADTKNETLTAFATGLYADNKALSLADFIAPDVPTGTTDGDYFEFDRGIPFQVIDTVIDEETSPQKVKANATKKKYSIELHGLQCGVTDWSRRKAGDAADLTTENKIRTLLSTQFVSREFQLSQAIAKTTQKETVTWLGDAGKSKDIVAELDQYILTVSQACGGVVMPNRMTIPLKLWLAIKNHPSIRERLQGISASAALSTFAGMLGNPEIEIRVGSLCYNAAARGKGEPNYQPIYGDSILLFYNEQNPTPESFGFMKTFVVDGLETAQVHTLRDDTPPARDKHYLLWAQELKETAAHAGLLINVQ